ncbi:MAG: efflux RND transporter periplasmic adaptor subunit [Candidatus Nanopelagicales bacterium]|nr:efflux RND transporter periplasmic adaptor subunit [Candidatus Nanopelagicales bacterium]MCF8538395.1 efflux RND transporter periplasmic adaptor subunit [Candidatus Nanopelagicales bacterium]MCF8543310.1 efflux RND transporter periplasmic adaptor subunit [Candidatus Nanopelagicales bacterium]
MRRRVLWINVGLAVLLLAVVGVGLALLAPDSPELTGRTVPAQSGTVSETVTATGTVETSGVVEVAFETSGTVATVAVNEGDDIQAEDELAALDDTAQRQALASAKSSYAQAVTSADQSGLSLSAAQQNVAEAERNQRINRKTYAQSVSVARQSLADAQSSWSEGCLTPEGACPDDAVWSQLRAAEADVVSAQTAYDQAVQSATKTAETNQVKLSQAQVNVDNARSTQTSQCDTYGSDSSACVSAVNALRSAEQAYALQVKANETADIAAQQSLVNADARITAANVTLRKLQSTLRSSASDAVTAARNSLESALLTQQKGLEADRQAVQAAKESLSSQNAAAQPVTIGDAQVTTSQAAIDVARAGLTLAEDNLAKTVLTTPTDGTVAAIEIIAGDTVTPGVTVMTVVPDAPFEIVAEFSEADALKLAPGQPATVSFDALPGTSAAGTVTSVALLPTAATTTGQVTGSGVTTYSATITLDDSPGGVKEGMSVSVVVTTQQVDDVIWVPTAAITTVGGVSTVTVRSGEVDTVVEITTGLAGDAGTEVTSGVSVGDELVIDLGDAGTFTGFGRNGGFGGGPPPSGG